MPTKEADRKVSFSFFMRPDLSPLRYPGGKRKLAPMLAHLLLLAGRKPKLFIEPFAGGAAVSIALLEQGLIEAIALADRDPLIAGFWSVVFSPQASKLADRIYDTAISVKEWDRQRKSDPTDPVEIAFKCLYLNRTSFSGSLMDRTGPIGGARQKGAYKIDCRFNRSVLAERVLELSRLSSHVAFVRCQGYRATFAQMRRRADGSSALWYLDPPFFNKAKRLYRYSFEPQEHEDLADQLDTLPGEWVLSYDDVPQARQMYQAHPGFAVVNLQYTARVDDGARLVSSEVLVSGLIAELRHAGKLRSKEQDIRLARKDFISQPQASSDSRRPSHDRAHHQSDVAGQQPTPQADRRGHGL